MKKLPIIIAALLLAGCAGMMETSGAGAVGESEKPYTQRILTPDDMYYGD